MPRKSFNGSAAPTTLSANITAGSTSFIAVAGASFPDGSEGPGPFVVSIGRNTANEEKILCSSRSGNTFTVQTRGYDDTSAISHTAGDSIEHVLDADTVDQVNRMANIGTTAGDTMYFSAAGVAQRRGIGTEGRAYRVSSGVPQWDRLGIAGLQADAWDSWTPVVTQGLTPTLTNTRSRKTKGMNRTVDFDFDLSMTSVGTAGTQVALTLPETAAAAFGIIGVGFLYDAAPTVGYIPFLMNLISTTQFNLVAMAGGSNPVLGTVASPWNIALAANDGLRGSGRYEAAA